MSESHRNAPILLLDLADFSKYSDPPTRRTALEHFQQVLFNATTFLAPEVDDPFTIWPRHGTGDGYYVVFHNLPACAVMQVARNIQSELDTHNTALASTLPLHARLSLTFGDVEWVKDQLLSDQFIEAARLIDYSQFKQHLKDTKASSVLMTSALFHTKLKTTTESKKHETKYKHLKDLQWTEIDVTDKHKNHFKAFLLGPKWKEPETPSRRPRKKQPALANTPPPPASPSNLIPTPPTPYHAPRYIASHAFIGRAAELDRLSDWATPADPNPVLLFEAIGGSGKSHLTWHWTNTLAPKIRTDLAGTFWYSFYDRGAIMSDFCRHALAYITQQPLKSFENCKTQDLADELLAHLTQKPYLLILDGLERILVAYHRSDAASLRDEEADTATDQIAKRDACAAIRPEDDDLLKRLSTATPSKILISTRLTPKTLLNPSSLPIPGVLRVPLPGLRPPDAEALFKACGIKGNSADIQSFLKSNCDCHPLTTAVLAGLIAHAPPPLRHNFDLWLTHPTGALALNLANLDLIQKRNHILTTALKDLPPKSRELLSTLALINEPVDYPTLEALNPHLPPEPEEIKAPTNPQEFSYWNELPKEDKHKRLVRYQSALTARKTYETALAAYQSSSAFRSAPAKLIKTLQDLEQRGLLQYDPNTQQHDLHPVVRGIASGNLSPTDTETLGQRVVDHFSSKPHNPYENAQTLDDVRDGLHVVRALLRMNRPEQAAETYNAGIHIALTNSLEAYHESLALLHLFFPMGWDVVPEHFNRQIANDLLSDAATILDRIGQPTIAVSILGTTLLPLIQEERWSALRISISNLGVFYVSLNRLALANRCRKYALDLAILMGHESALFSARAHLFDQFSCLGKWAAAETLRQSLTQMDRTSLRITNLRELSETEFDYAQFLFFQARLQATHLTTATSLANEGNNRITLRDVHRLSGEWHFSRGEYTAAVDRFCQAITMAREVRLNDPKSETYLALVSSRLDPQMDILAEADRLASQRNVAPYPLAELYLTAGNHERAIHYALEAYKYAWADGEPFVHRYHLNQVIDLLRRLNHPIPTLPPYDESKHEKLPWEDEVIAAIEKLKNKKKPKPPPLKLHPNSFHF